jgi:hypothetical protein
LRKKPSDINEREFQYLLVEDKMPVDEVVDDEANNDDDDEGVSEEISHNCSNQIFGSAPIYINSIRLG